MTNLPMNSSILLVLCLACTSSAATLCAQGQASDDTLQKMVRNEDRDVARRAMLMASPAQKAAILKLALDHPNWDAKTEAVRAMGTLPQAEARVDLLEALRNKSVWESKVRFAGEIAAVHDSFLDNLKSSITKAWNVDVSGVDLMDAAQRAALINRLNTVEP